MTELVALGAGDATPAIALWAAAGLTRPWNPPEADFLRAVAGPSSAVLGIRDGDALIGTAMVGHDGHRGWLYYVAVDAARRGEGLGARLVAAAESWLRERGIPKAQLMVRADNADVVGFYEHLGYEDQSVVVLGRRLEARDAASSSPI